MDKELLRLFVLAVGSILIISVIIWGILVNRPSRPSRSKLRNLLHKNANMSPKSSVTVANTSLGIIQFSVVAKNDAKFNGTKLADCLSAMGLQYMQSQIFQRLNANNQPNYTVASMLEPGTFPKQDMGNFRCSGIVFFMQPTTLHNPMEVYDELIDNITNLAITLDADIWDGNRQLLTIEKIQAIRNQLTLN